MLYATDILALMALAGISVPQDTAAPTLCHAGEDTVLYGQVQDDLGLDVAVCLSGDEEKRHLTIRWVGEGGGAAVSCRFGECDGIVEYSRYTSPHLSILQLAWRKDGSIQRLYQTLDRAGPGKVAKHTTSHSWERAGAASSDVRTYDVISDAEPLQLMHLEEVLSRRDLSTPLLFKALQ